MLQDLNLNMFYGRYDIFCILNDHHLHFGLWPELELVGWCAVQLCTFGSKLERGEYWLSCYESTLGRFCNQTWQGVVKCWTAILLWDVLIYDWTALLLELLGMVHARIINMILYYVLCIICLYVQCAVSRFLNASNCTDSADNVWWRADKVTTRLGIDLLFGPFIELSLWGLGNCYGKDWGFGERLEEIGCPERLSDSAFGRLLWKPSPLQQSGAQEA